MRKTYAILSVTAILFGTTLTAQTVTSSSFSFAYGADNISNTAVWGTTETAGVNTATTQGDFSFTPTITTGGRFANPGPFFTGGVLTDGSSTVGFIGRGDQFAVSINGQYNGLLGAGQTATTTLRITNISVYAFDSTIHGGDDQFVSWAETTVGNVQISPTTELQQVAYSSVPALTASTYNNIAWNAGDYSLAGTSVSRSFEISGNPGIPMDGFLVQGVVETTIVPEPAAYSLLAGALILGLAVSRRKRSAR